MQAMTKQGGAIGVYSGVKAKADEIPSSVNVYWYVFLGALEKQIWLIYTRTSTEHQHQCSPETALTECQSFICFRNCILL